MNARANAEQLVQRLAAQAKPTRHEPKTRRVKSWVIICELCVALGRDKTEHAVKHPRARCCEEHQQQGQSMRKYQRHGPKLRAKVRARYRGNRDAAVARVTQWKRDHPERSGSYAKQYREDHREELRAYFENHRKAWRIPWRTRGVEPAPACVPAEVF